MDDVREHCGEHRREVDVVVTGVDDLDIVAAAETAVRAAFAASALDGRWTVALRPRRVVGAWTVGVVGLCDHTHVRLLLRIVPTDGLRVPLHAMFEFIAFGWASHHGIPDREVA